MKTREKLEDYFELANPESGSYNKSPDEHVRLRIILEVLLDIRELLMARGGFVSSSGALLHRDYVLTHDQLDSLRELMTPDGRDKLDALRAELDERKTNA